MQLFLGNRPQQEIYGSCAQYILYEYIAELTSHILDLLVIEACNELRKKHKISSHGIVNSN